MPPLHLLPPENRKRVIEIKDMFIDVGVQEKYDVKKKLHIQLGDPIIPDSQFTLMGNKKMYMAKAFDNRVACAVVLEVMRKLQKSRHPNTVLGCATAQEEVGARGAQTLAYHAKPDVCIVCDTCIGHDIPPDGFKKNEKLGSGPAVLLYDTSMIPNLGLRDLVVETAQSRKIPFHLTYMERGGTDGGRIHISRTGVPSIVIGPPVRYMHSHNGILNRSDYDNAVKLIVEVIRKLTVSTVRSFTEV
jgi:endoglucanase